jgi:hypothetical protein
LTKLYRGQTVTFPFIERRPTVPTPPKRRVADTRTEVDRRQMARVRFHGIEPLYEAEVIRLSPDEMRLAFAQSLRPADLPMVRLHASVDIELPLPRPRKPVVTHGRIVGICHDYDPQRPPLTIDIAFRELTAEEEIALRESNPGILAG